MWFKKKFKNKHIEIVIETNQLNKPKKHCVKPMGEICFGDETDIRCGNCGHWI